TFGCNTTVFTWCETTELIELYAWFPFAVVFIGLAMPLALISLDTLYSRVLERSPQSDLLQGLFALVECFTLGYVPILYLHQKLHTETFDS
ncbi:hypothetical protein PMAYCL1PPCAC_30485, partial [Pristionchus mayeri]